MREPVPKVLPSILIATLIGSAIAYGLQQQDLQDKLLVVKEQLSTTQEDLLGYTSYTTYLTESKQALTERMKFLAAKVDREYVQIEHIQKSTLGFTSDATVIVKYAVEYSFGFDLRPDQFTISGDRNGITITVPKPELVASPAVKILSNEIPSTGAFIDEQEAVIAVQQQLFGVARQRAVAIKNDEAVIALCEKKLEEFLRAFLVRQPNVGVIPTIKIAYR